MTSPSEPAGTLAKTVTLEVADKSLNYHDVHIDDATPTGRQVAKAAGYPPDAVVQRVLADSTLELVDPDKPVDLRHLRGRFLITVSDRLFLFEVEQDRYEWPSNLISGAQVRKLANIDPAMELWLPRTEQPDRLVHAHDIVDLDHPGIEHFEVRKRSWTLNVHGVSIVSYSPTVKVRDALTEAQIDPNKPWHIFFLVKDQPKREVGLDDILDLTAHGIEKLRLTPRNVDNGEADTPPRRQFALLPVDTEYLRRLGMKWETVIVEQRRWLLIHNYPLPVGYTVSHTLLALDIPSNYPQAALYGFYAYPPLALQSGRTIPRTQMRGIVNGVEFHGWSRYRPDQPWNPASDSVVTQLALVEAALAKEAGV